MQKNNNSCNIREDFLSFLECHGISYESIKHAEISVRNDKYETIAEFYLPLGFTKAEWEEFLLKLDFEYAPVANLRVVLGEILLCDGSWIERKLCQDGREVWAYFAISN